MSGRGSEAQSRARAIRRKLAHFPRPDKPDDQGGDGAAYTVRTGNLLALCRLQRGQLPVYDATHSEQLRAIEIAG